MVNFQHYIPPSTEALTHGTIRLEPREGLQHNISNQMRWRNLKYKIITSLVRRPNLIPSVITAGIPLGQLKSHNLCRFAVQV